MPNPYFRFKQFTVWHDKCAMKVGTDGVLLGAWVNVQGCAALLDVGTGTGLIALMLAQRTSASARIDIDAIDIDGDACLQARENIAASPFAAAVRVHHSALKAYSRQAAAGSYDLIVSNPPYFARSLKSPEQKRSLARHNDSLPLTELIRDAKALLSDTGRIALILSADQEAALAQAADTHQLHIVRQTTVIPLAGGKAKRLLVELSPATCPACQTDTLVLEEQHHRLTAEYRALTEAYYL
ncbi:tRNA1(Val) (adenine(37)-N6)-methyltransferase [Bacteroidales bacterium Barb7]|nr:tRNA1(Val) (adenine(37)-N6)-methyltransferase [Bacteroidales bacterium Barb7]